jgi:hypothetical protein
MTKGVPEHDGVNMTQLQGPDAVTVDNTKRLKVDDDHESQQHKCDHIGPCCHHANGCPGKRRQTTAMNEKRKTVFRLAHDAFVANQSYHYDFSDHHLMHDNFRRLEKDSPWAHGQGYWNDYLPENDHIDIA